MLSEDILSQLVRQFPVCMASDEFHFFPQACFDPRDWSAWDDFSESGIQSVSRQFDGWIHAVDEIEGRTIDADTRVDMFMLRQMMTTLREQLLDIAPHKYQPTFYLTIMGIGIAEAMDAGMDAVSERLSTLPDFIDQARVHLRRVPRLFRNLGIEMTDRMREWVKQLPLDSQRLASSVTALNRLSGHLQQISVIDGFLPERAYYERIAAYHMGCEMDLTEIAKEIDREIDETRQELMRWAKQTAPGMSWQTAINALPKPQLPAGGEKTLYREVISELGGHCAEMGFLAREDLSACPVTVSAVPDYMRPIRSSAAYSMPPVHPPTGGTFYIAPQKNPSGIFTDYRLMTAHETYPGHHLLDMNRWRHPRPVRRHIEFPLFYEGWACLAEELMFETGFFSSLRDRVLLAMRRFWRAVRGRVDFDIHTRRKTPEVAVAFLCGHGMERSDAEAMVNRCMLKPGYQLAYAIGRRGFRRLYDEFGQGQQRTAAFVRQVLSAGQVGFDHMKVILKRREKL